MPSNERSANGSASKDRLRVIIVGGSISGLTLAHCLHTNPNIDYVVLEAADDIAPQVGASIVVLPNAARILDQLGIWDDIYAMIEPLAQGLTWTREGKLLNRDNGPLLSATRMGYDFAFLTRHDLLKVLFDHIKDKSKVRTSKRVTTIEQTSSGVTVTCKDGSSYSGDIVVGADGIHSTVRSLMQDHIEKSNPGSTEKDRKSISAEYNCIFGLGKPVDGVVSVGDSHRSLTKNHSTLSFVGRGGVLYWFLFSKLDKRYHGSEIPRYTKEEMEEAVKAFNDIHMTESITYGQVWERRTFANMLCVEESQNEHWTADRIVCLGDAVHKMTPNLGAGGNAAIESAAALANHIFKLSSTPSLEDIRKVLNEYYVKRHLRVNLTCDKANELTRLEAWNTWPEQIMTTHVAPAMGDFGPDVICDVLVAAELLESLPAPPRSLNATFPYDQEAGIGKKEKKWVRALYALPLLACVYGCQRTMWTVIPNLIPLAAEPGNVNLGNGIITSLASRFFGLAGLDSFVQNYVAIFTPSIGGFDPAGRMQAIAFLGDLMPIQTIWMIESIRRGNIATAAHLLPTIFGVLYQIKGIGFIAPIYFFLHYVQSPLENYAAADNRMAVISSAKTIIPTITLSYILPSIAMFVAPKLAIRQCINGAIWQPFPIYAALIQRVLSKTVKDTTYEDRIKNPEADMPWLRRAYGFAGLTAAAAYLYVRIASPVSLFDVFFKGLSDPAKALPLIEGAAKVLRYDQIAAFSAGGLWVLLSFGDLKKAKKLKTGWAGIIGVFAGTTLLAGPGAAMTAMWAWREEVLAKRKPIEEKK
ncbi:monooxygenase [Acephala macrosclerotiorum]|nr:monooxygenase [Acephala macrosclerotiorum]